MSRYVVLYPAFLSFSKFILFIALRFKIIQIPFFSFFFPDVGEHNVTTLQKFLCCAPTNYSRHTAHPDCSSTFVRSLMVLRLVNKIYLPNQASNRLLICHSDRSRSLSAANYHVPRRTRCSNGSQHPTYREIHLNDVINSLLDNEKDHFPRTFYSANANEIDKRCVGYSLNIKQSVVSSSRLF